MARIQFKYPPCQLNPLTERPYTRHRWEITGTKATKLRNSEDVIHFYRVICSRCGISDKNSPTH